MSGRVSNEVISATEIRPQLIFSFPYASKRELAIFERNIGSMDDCWVGKNPGSTGYWTTWVRGKVSSAQRLAYICAHEEIPEGMVIDHLCRNRACVNPAHLQAVTQRENIKRGSLCQPQCKHGHEFTAENTLRDKYGRRRCRICRDAKNKARFAKKP